MPRKPDNHSVRFSLLVTQSGNPEMAVLFSEPSDDKAFMRLVRLKRIITVVQFPGGGKQDYGIVGFYPSKSKSFMVFAKPLRVPNETRVVGIKYNMLNQSEGPLLVAIESKHVEKKHPVAVKQAQNSAFTVHIRSTFYHEEKLTLFAKDAEMAELIARKHAKSLKIPARFYHLSDEIISTVVKSKK